MRHTGWEWTRVAGLVLVLVTNGWAQDEPEQLSALDRLPTWRLSAPEPGSRRQRAASAPNTYTDLDDLVRQQAAGQRIDALELTGRVIGPNAHKLSALLPTVRVLTLKNLTTNQADSLFNLVRRGARLERLTIDITTPGSGRADPNRLVRLPGTLRRFRHLRDLYIQEDGLNWTESVAVLAGIATLRRLSVNRWSSRLTDSQQPVLAPLTQLTALELHNNGWVPTPETLGPLPRLTELTLSSLQVDTGTLAATLLTLPALATLRLTKCWRVETLPAGVLGRLKTVELAYNDRLQIDALLTGLQRVEQLTIKGGQLTDLTGLGDLSRLRYLNVMGGSQLAVLPETIGRLHRLTDLRLYDVCLGSLPAGFGTLHRLQTLHLNQCGLDLLPAAFGRLTALRDLTLYGNRLRQLPDMSRLTALRHLNLSGNQLTTLPDGIGSLTGLTTLNLSENQFHELPVSVTRLVGLKQVAAEHNRLTALPDALGQFVHLTDLAVGSNQLVQLPASLSRLTSLTALSAGYNRLERLPDGLGNLRNLRSLSLDHNQLTQLPAGIGQLDSLRYLWLGQNRLCALPAGVGQLHGLRELAIDDNDIAELPADLSGLHQLTTLSLYRLALTELPASVGALINLRSLSIADTKLRELPDTIGALVNLQSVRLVNNRLTTLPNSIGRWQSVTTLELTGNRLEYLPNGIGRMTNLTKLVIARRSVEQVEVQDGVVYCSFGKDDVRKPEPTGVSSLRQLPDSLIYCDRLQTLAITDQPRLDASDVFTKAARLKSLTTLSVINCGVSRLPEVDWKTVPWQKLIITDNQLTDLPYGLVDVPGLHLISASGNRLPSALNGLIRGQQALLGSFAESDKLPLHRADGPDGKLTQALLRSAHDKGQVNDWAGGVSALTKALRYAPDSTRAQIYAERTSLYQAHKQYADALADLDSAIVYTPRFRDGPTYNPRLPDRVIDNQAIINATLVAHWQWKVRLLADMGQYNGALTSLDRAARLLPTNPLPTHVQTSGAIEMARGRYLVLLGRRPAADSSYRKAIDAYARSNRPNTSTYLLMVDLCLVTGQYDRAEQILAGLQPEERQKEFNTLAEYLRACLAILQGKQTGAQAVETLLAYRVNHPDIMRRQFALSEAWLTGSTLSADKIRALRQLKEAADGWMIHR